MIRRRPQPTGGTYVGDRPHPQVLAGSSRPDEVRRHRNGARGVSSGRGLLGRWSLDGCDRNDRRPPDRSSRSPGACRSSTGPATATATTTPTRSERFLWEQYADDDRRHPAVHAVRERRPGYTKVASGAAQLRRRASVRLRYQDWVDLGVLQPWDTSLIPNYSALNPNLMRVRDRRRPAVLHPARLGLHRAAREPRPRGRAARRRSASCSTSATRARSRGSTRSNMMYIAGLLLGVGDPFDMTDEELAEVRDFLISKKPLVRFYVELSPTTSGWPSRRKRSGSDTPGPTRSATRTRTG